MATNTAEFIFEFAEAISAIALPVGGGLAAYAKWRRSAERDNRARQEAARIAAERTARDVRQGEATLRDALLAEKDKRLADKDRVIAEQQAEIERLKNDQH